MVSMTTATALQTQARNIAIVHDYMTQLGGAERVAGVIAAMVPTARLYTSVHREREVPLEFIGGRGWQTSFLQPFAGRLPLMAMLPLLPKAIASLDVRGSDLVVSTSSAFAHHVTPPRGATHVCYCSAPPHFLWNQPEYFRGRPNLERTLAPLLSAMRRLDLAATARVDAYIVNSRYTAGRVREVYGRDAQVVYPPVETERFRPSGDRSGRFAVVSRLVPTKRVELVVEAANRFELPLDVIGKGPELSRLRKLAGPTVRVHGWLPDALVRRAMAESIAVVVAGTEDFGLVTAEAQASGRPPVAFAAGGALEIIEDGVTGFLFDDQTPEALGEAMLRARDHQLATTDLLASAARFDVPVFLETLDAAIDAATRATAITAITGAEVTS
jgi:glycosyltransferase involved in cell wall biosynthesis